MERPALLLLSEPQESHSKDEPVYLYTELNSITVLIQKGLYAILNNYVLCSNC